MKRYHYMSVFRCAMCWPHLETSFLEVCNVFITMQSKKILLCRKSISKEFRDKQIVKHELLL